MGRKANIRNEEHRRSIPKKTWKKGEPIEKLKEALRGISDLVNRRKAWLQYLGSEYAKTKNPLYPWDARSLAREWRLPIPEWVEEYLDRVGKKLLHAENKVTVITWALGFKGDIGRTSQFRQYELRHAKEYAVALMEHYISEGDSVEYAAGRAADEAGKFFGIKLSGENILRYRMKRNKPNNPA